ncbi:MAG TPA: hypothetical protein VJB92_01850 [Candidatus Paceibacterota bacterium]
MAVISITDGPSKWDLMLAFFDWDRKRRREIVFELEDIEFLAGNPKLRPHFFTIRGLTREGVSGEDWRFEADYRMPESNTPCGSARGSFSTHTRKGWVKFSSQPSPPAIE